MASLLSYALTNLSDVKESLGIASSDTSYDNLIIRNINKATLAIENYCGRRFLDTTYTQEQYNPTQTNELILKQRPITTTSPFLFEIRNSILNEDSWETITSDLYFTDNNAGLLYLNFQATGLWKRFRVTYSAGYATIPADLAEACVALAAYWTINADGSQIGVQEVREGQRQKRYLNTSLDFDTIAQNLGIDQILSSYANMPLMTDR
jgi:hypothetical protein